MQHAGPPEELGRLCSAVIFCGGQATRLRDNLRGTPKALVVLDRRPYLHSLLVRIRDAGLNKVVLCVSPFTDEIINLVRGGEDYGLQISYSLDSGLLENADALWQARNKILTPLAICINGDTIFDIDFTKLVETHLGGGTVATLVASERLDQPHPDGVEILPNNRVVDLDEKAQDLGLPVVRSASATGYSNSGVYIFDMRRLEKNWSEEDRVGKIEQGLLRSLAGKGQLSAMRNGRRYLLDIGTPERLMIARSQLDSISRILAV